MATKSGEEGKASAGKAKALRLWINDEWYIPVDDTGRCTGLYAEGALGFVVQLLSDIKDHRLALKLPRFVGETHRENAYISELMEKELKAVYDVMLKKNTEGLLTAQRWTRRGPMQGQINTQNGLPEAQAWHDAIVLFRFKKGQDPRFCLVKKDIHRGTVAHFPAGINDCPITTIASYEQMEERAKGRKYPWDQTVFIDLGVKRENNDLEAESEATIFTKDQALSIDPLGETWYASIPSVTYLWAPGTLQEAISLSKRGSWDVSQHIALVRRLCRGVYALHRNGMLHADLRPSNIAYLEDSAEPNNYFLSDYGSFAEAGARAAERNPTGETVLGPVVGTERVSPFYAPERRAGQEREAADTAIIFNSDGSNTLDILLGWRSDLVDEKTSSASNGLRNVLEHAFQNQSEDPSLASTLLAGDRIQIRDYIFDIIQSANVEEKQALRCHKRSWKIYHGRIVVLNTDDFHTRDWFPIPRTVELKQWSAATDLYSLGALALYSVYRDDGKAIDESVNKIEEDFRMMLTYLESPPYFNSIWPEIEWFRQQLEVNLTNYSKLSFAEFSKLTFQRRNGSDLGDSNLLEPNTTLLEEAIALVRRISQTVPGTRRLVEVFDFRLGPFILFIHFVLCCLHRQNHLVNIEGWTELPFCKDRLEVPRENGGAKHAMKRLEKISRLIDIDNLAALNTVKSEIPEFDPRPDPAIRVAMHYLLEQYDKTIKDGLGLLNGAGFFIRANKVKAIFSDASKAIKRSKSPGLTVENDEQSKAGTEK